MTCGIDDEDVYNVDDHFTLKNGHKIEFAIF